MCGVIIVVVLILDRKWYGVCVLGSRNCCGYGCVVGVDFFGCVCVVCVFVGFVVYCVGLDGVD